jgi:hypothetical protein
MQFKKGFLWIAGSLMGVAVIGSLSTPSLSAQSIKQTLVELLLPSQPFQATLAVPSEGQVVTAGPSAFRTLGVTSLVLTNLAPTVETVIIFQPAFSAGAFCGDVDARFGGPGSIQMAVKLQPNQTLSIPFPSPLVFTQINNQSCIGVTGSAKIQTYVTGFVN